MKRRHAAGDRVVGDEPVVAVEFNPAAVATFAKE
jgi:hypothetical protein